MFTEIRAGWEVFKILNPILILHHVLTADCLVLGKKRLYALAKAFSFQPFASPLTLGFPLRVGSQ